MPDMFAPISVRVRLRLLADGSSVRAAQFKFTQLVISYSRASRGWVPGGWLVGCDARGVCALAPTSGWRARLGVDAATLRRAAK